MRNSDDHHLIQRTLQGELDAFAEIVSKYKKIFYFTLYHMVRNKQDAEDLTQETFIRAYDRLNQLENLITFGHAY